MMIHHRQQNGRSPKVFNESYNPITHTLHNLNGPKFPSHDSSKFTLSKTRMKIYEQKL